MIKPLPTLRMDAKMSVIPLILEGTQRTVVETAEDFGNLGGYEGQALWIQNLDTTQLSSQQDSNVTYDLRVGRLYRDHRDTSPTELRDREAIDVAPGVAMIIETEEHITVPRSLFGQIVPRVSLLQKGLSNTSSKVDPGYSGHLLVTVFNLGKQGVPLRRSEGFCSICFFQVRAGARLYAGGEKRIREMPAEKTWWKWLRGWFDKNASILIPISIIATSALAIITSALVIIEILRILTIIR